MFSTFKVLGSSCAPSGLLISSGNCDGYTRYSIYTNGNCGFYRVNTQTNSPSCGYVDPCAGCPAPYTVVSSYCSYYGCSGNPGCDLVTNYANGCCGIVESSCDNCGCCGGSC